MKNSIFKFFSLLSISLISLGCIETDTQNQTQSAVENPQIDDARFLNAAQKAMKIREKRLLTEEQFIAKAKEKGVIVLDARSKDKFAECHIEGAVNLPFTDITIESIAKLLPDKNTTILIYCNNNFKSDLHSFPIKSVGSALNLSTFSTLFEHEYTNVYELGPAVDMTKTKLTMAGTNAKQTVTNSK